MNVRGWKRPGFRFKGEMHRRWGITQAGRGNRRKLRRSIRAPGGAVMRLQSDKLGVEPRKHRLRMPVYGVRRFFVFRRVVLRLCCQN